MILTQLKSYGAAIIGVIMAGLGILAGFFKLRLEQKKREISDIKKDSAQHAMEQIQDAQEAQHKAGVKADDKAKKDIESAKRGDRSHFS